MRFIFYCNFCCRFYCREAKGSAPGVDKQHQSIWQNKFLPPSFNFFPDSFLFIGQKSVCTVTCSDCWRLAVEPLCGNRLLVYHLTKKPQAICGLRGLSFLQLLNKTNIQAVLDQIKQPNAKKHLIFYILHSIKIKKLH